MEESCLTDKLQNDCWEYPLGTETTTGRSLQEESQNWQLVEHVPRVVKHVGGVVEW